MTSEAPLPVLPKYDAPQDPTPATIPQGLEVTKMPGVMNKMITRMLTKLPKMKMPKMKVKGVHARHHKTKTKKLKVKIK